MALRARHVRGVRQRSGARPAAPAQPQAPNVPPIDFSADPILQQIQALAQQNIASAEASTQAQRQRALVSYGYDPALSGLYGDANTQTAAQQNPFSETANLERQHTQRQQSLNENLNKANLFYSSYRGKQLQNEGTQYLGEQAASAQKLQDYLGGLEQNLLAAKQQAQGQVSQAQQDAYGRALETALKYGGVGVAPRAIAVHRPSGVRGAIRRVHHG